jgi:PIN domain nuclease of toxin-antitoxin system
MTVVLDASAIMAVIRHEQGRDRVIQALASAVASSVSFAEVVGKLVRHGMPPGLAKAEFVSLGVRTVPFDDDQAYEAGALRRHSHHLQLSLADRACLALARLRDLPVLTSDRRWSELNIGVEIRQIR